MWPDWILKRFNQAPNTGWSVKSQRSHKTRSLDASAGSFLPMTPPFNGQLPIKHCSRSITISIRTNPRMVSKKDNHSHEPRSNHPRLTHSALLRTREPVDKGVVKIIALLAAIRCHLRRITSSRALKAQWLSDSHLKTCYQAGPASYAAPVLVLALAPGWNWAGPGADYT